MGGSNGCTILQTYLISLNCKLKNGKDGKFYVMHFVVVQSLSHVQLLMTPRTAALQASLSLTTSWSLLQFMSVESLMLSNHFILCCPLFLLPSISPSITVFSNELALCIRWPKNWSFSFGISPSRDYSGLIPFNIDWLV